MSVERMSTRRRVAWDRTLGTLFACLLAAQAGAQTLTDLYRKAQGQDAQYLAARYALQAALEKLPQARAGLLPGVNLNASQGYQVGRASFSDGPWIDRSPSTWSWTLQLNQPLLRAGNWAALAQADAQTRQAEAQMVQAEQELILRCAQAYLDVVQAMQNVRVLQAQLDAVAEQLAVAQRTYEVGTGTITDVHEARSRHALTESQKVAAQTDLSVKEAEIERILGEPMSVSRVQLAGDLPALERPWEEWRDAALAHYPQVRAQEAALEAASHEVAKSERGHWPTLDLTANVAGNYSSGSLGSPADLSSRVESNSVGLQLAIPVYAGGGTQSRLREALALREKAAAEYQTAQRTARVQARQAFLGVGSGLAQIAALRIALQAGQSAVEGNQIGYRIGTRINPDVLNAQQLLYSTQRDLGRARAEALMQGLKLKAAVGELQIQDLAALELLLEPQP